MNPAAPLPGDAELFGHDHALGRWAGPVQALAQQLAATAVARDRAGGTALTERGLLRDSGLLTLLVPAAFGGAGASWPLILRAVRRLAAADSSLAHLFAFQHLQVATVLLFGTPAQQQRLLTATVAQRWFWGNATNDRDVRLQFAPGPQGWQLAGERSFCSGAVDADALIVNVPHPALAGARLFLAVPADRPGLQVAQDWDAFGQRQTDSGTVRFAATPVAPEDRLGWPGDAQPLPRGPRQTLRACIAQSILTELYLGNSEGALLAARDFVVQRTRPWPGAGADSAAATGAIQLRFGEHWLAYRGARRLADAATQRLEQAWQAGDALDAAERGALALEIAEARCAAAAAGLAVTGGLFEQMGASATAAPLGLDRYWRNVRVHSLHDPLDLKREALGRWLLQGRLPEPSGFG